MFSQGDNLLMAKDGRVCLADFGIAQKCSQGETELEMEEEVAGTPFWRMFCS
jgi:hypothetical protein